MSESAKILVLAAHPDDAEFNAAGTVARWTGEGRSVVYVLCTSGEKGTTDRNVKPERLAAVREAEQAAAAAVLGVREVVFLRFPDQGLEETPAFRKEIVRQIRIYRPKTIVTSDPYHRYIGHRDHRIVGQVALDAVYPFARDHLAYPDLLAEGLEPHKVKEMLFWDSEEINFRADITTTFHLKVKALRCHKSQIAELGLTDPECWLRERCRAAAAGENFELGEAFFRLNIDR